MGEEFGHISYSRKAMVDFVMLTFGLVFSPEWS